MNWLVFHFASGQAFFSGIALVLLAVFAATRSATVFKRVTFLAFAIGAIAIALSSTPIPYWYYTLATGMTISWIVSWFIKSWRFWTSIGVVAIWIIAAIMELPFHFMPSVQSIPTRTMTVIGDSVSAGLGGSEKSKTWPIIFASQHDVAVQDISHVGETVRTALKRAQSQAINSDLVIIEIGGNDLLGPTSAVDFATELDALLTYLSKPNRQLVMFELPLPPFRQEYGRVQRQVASKHGVRLVPKRIFLSVIAEGGSTIDSIHLSQAGHQKMADCVWSIAGGAFGKPAK